MSNFALSTGAPEVQGYHKICGFLTNLAHTHTHTYPFNGPLSGTTRVGRYQKGKTNLDLLKQETVNGNGINWAICKSAPRSRQITTPAPHHSFFYRPDALPAAQPTASKHWRPANLTNLAQDCKPVVCCFFAKFPSLNHCITLPTYVKKRPKTAILKTKFPTLGAEVPTPTN